MIDYRLLQQLYQIREDTAKVWTPYVNDALTLAECNNDNRRAYFLAQVGHESGGLKWTSELWGPTPQQRRYERNFDASWSPKSLPNSLAYRLGNWKAGDGSLFRGRGLIQITGRSNYVYSEIRLKRILGTGVVSNLVGHPEQMRQPKLAALSAAEWWLSRKLNKFSDVNDIIGQTRVINGGSNGLAARQHLYNRFFTINKG